jgi:hypothetical protein
VAPYFDQSGISILLRKKQPKQSIFKFMTVLKPEVNQTHNTTLFTDAIFVSASLASSYAFCWSG